MEKSRFHFKIKYINSITRIYKPYFPIKISLVDYLLFLHLKNRILQILYP